MFFFGLCIFLHELGHLLVALWRGLHVERFSIGFGKKLWGRTHKGVEYIVSALPFGGYVALPQLDPTEEPTTSDGKPLPPGPPVDRILTAVAGPFANVLFGFFLALFVWEIGVDKPAPADYCDVLSVPETSAEYKAGLRPGDRIVAVNGKGFVRGWEELSHVITLSPGAVVLSVQRGAEKRDITYRPDKNPETEGLGYPFFSVWVPIVLRRVMPNSPAQAAGLLAGDRILRVNGEPLEKTDEFITCVQESAGRELPLTVERDGRKLTVSGLRAELKQTDSGPTYRIGVEFGAYVRTHPTPWEQAVSIFRQTRDTLRALFTRGSHVKARHMSGPVGIVQIIWLKVSAGGFIEGLSFIILITFNLAFLNMLPLPVLDGGHIVFGLLELISRRRLPTRVAHALQTAFAALLICFMLYVTFHDIKRSLRIRRLRSAAAAEEQQKPAAPADAGATEPTDERAPAEGTAADPTPKQEPDAADAPDPTPEQEPDAADAAEQ